MLMFDVVLLAGDFDVAKVGRMEGLKCSVRVLCMRACYAVIYVCLRVSFRKGGPGVCVTRYGVQPASYPRALSVSPWFDMCRVYLSLIWL